MHTQLIREALVGYPARRERERQRTISIRLDHNSEAKINYFLSSSWPQPERRRESWLDMLLEQREQPSRQ